MKVKDGITFRGKSWSYVMRVTDLKTGKSKILRAGKQLAEAQTTIREGGRFHIKFANVDDHRKAGQIGPQLGWLVHQ